MHTAERNALVVVILGLALGALALAADPLGLDLTPGFGLLQALGMLLGITMAASGGCYFLWHRRKPGGPLSLMSDVGLRLGLTGLLACYVSGIADVLGIGTHRGASWERPFLGPLQLAGLLLGLLIVLVGLLLFWLGERTEHRDDPANTL